MSDPTFTAEDRAFLRAILDVPEDRNTWLIYADWLEDRGDPRAEFLRLTVARSLLSEGDAVRSEMEARLKHLRAELDPHWMMVFDPAPVGNCASPRGCGQSWNELAATDMPDIRICYKCRQAVVYCHTLEDARQYVSCGQRVALSTRIPLVQIAQEPAFQNLAPPRDDDSDAVSELEEFLDAEPPAPRSPPPQPRRPWWKFW